MKISELLPIIGIMPEMLSKDLRSSGMDLNIDKGYEVRKMGIRTFDAIQVVKIYPNVDWTDGTCRPKWVTDYASIYLRKSLSQEAL